MKALLLIDMPDRCADCRFKDTATEYMKNEITFICHANEDVIICDVDAERDRECPLIPMPQYAHDNDAFYVKGFNDCLREIYYSTAKGRNR